MKNQPDPHHKIEDQLRRLPLEKPPATVYERLQKKATWNNPSSSAPSWPTIVIIVVLTLTPIFLRFMPKTGSLETPAIMKPAGVPTRSPVLQPPSGTAFVPPVHIANTVKQPAVDVFSPGGWMRPSEPPFQTTFGETAMAPWQTQSGFGS